MEIAERPTFELENELDSDLNIDVGNRHVSKNDKKSKTTVAPAATGSIARSKTTRRRALSAGIIPVYLAEAGPVFLLLRAYGYWDFPKGGANLNEEPLETAVREMREETTIEEVDFCWGFGFQETPPYSRGKVARYYLGRVMTMKVAMIPNPESGLIEHHEYRWVTYDQALKLVSERVLPILEWAYSAIAME